ncbi:MAG: hypothetical protein IJE48_01875 [Clostridia bacterium]|nr:hypothetical protein [Clostridia bacterium]
MKSNPVVKNALGEFRENELIIASKLYKEKLSEQISEAAYYKTLQRMCESGELVKVAKGTYHFPKASKYGIVPLSEKEIVAAFTQNETGTIIGYSLYNALNLTTQISKTVTVMSSELEGLTKSIRNVVVHQMPLEFSKEITSMIHGLEVLQNFNTIQDINYSAFLKFSEELAFSFDAQAFEEIISTKSYKKSTISFFENILNYYGVQNNLKKHLSSLSEYKHPRMEELYETARVFG